MRPKASIGGRALLPGIGCEELSSWPAKSWRANDDGRPRYQVARWPGLVSRAVLSRSETQVRFDHLAGCDRRRDRRRRRARPANSATREAQEGLPVALPGSTQPQLLSDGEAESPVAPPAA